MNRVPHCKECDCLKIYDYVYKCYYCDHENRTDDIGKLGVDYPPKTSPKWCPKRENLQDAIQMKTDITLTDKDGNVIEVKSLQSEYLLDSLL